MAERSVKVIISAIDRLTAPINRITNSLKPMDAAVKRVNDNLRVTDRESSKVVGSVNGATGALSRMGRQMGRTSSEASKALGKMGAFSAANDNLRWKLTRTSQAASAALGAMGAYSAAVDKADRSVRRFSADKLLSGLRGLGSRAASAGRALADLVTHAGHLGAVTAAGAAAGIAYLGKQVIDTSSTFERMAITLETVMGDKGKAQEALKWVSDFAQKTPFELKETSEAFVKLKSYGIDPMKGSLVNAGNAAAIMGKPLNQAVEALADAMTGENERLKEFGITAHIEGNKIQYNWTENGKAMTAFAKKNSRDQMLAVINGIWNRQYKGGMDKLSMTWSGMLSNISDAWTRVTQQIGEAGLFDFMKEQLKEILDYVSELQDSGKLKEWATGVSRAATDMLRKFKEFVTGIKWEEVGRKLMRIVGVVEKLADFVGGPLNLALLTIGAMTFGPLISSFTMLTVTLLPRLIKTLPLVITGFRALTVAMMTNPFIAITTALLALVAAAIYVGRNWDYFSRRLSKIMGGIAKSFSNAWERIKQAYTSFGRDVWTWVSGLMKRFTDFWGEQWDDVSTKTQEAFQGVVDWLSNFDMISVGKDLIQRMWDGMKNKWDDLKKWFFKKVKGLFHFWNNKGEDDSDGSPATTGSLPGGGSGTGAGAGGIGSGRRSFVSYAGGSGAQPGGRRTSMGQAGTGTSGDASNPGGATPSTKEGRGGANLMHGQYGGVGENQAFYTTKGGKRVQVHKEALESFKGFTDELESMGYKINSIGGLAIRGKAGNRSSISQHAYGNAIDINPSKNPFYKPKPGEPLRTDLPPNISDIAAKHGLSWGGDWKSVKDTMHFEWRGTTPEQRAKAAELKAKADADPHAGHHHGPNGEELGPTNSVQSAMQGAGATEETGGKTDLRKVAGLTKGLNNNNYGNLKFNPGTAYKRYPGVLGPSQNTDEGQPQIVFKSLEDGIKGAINMTKRLNSEGRDTVNKMISEKGGWTPGKQFAADNIAKSMGVKPDEQIDLSKPEVLKRFVKAMGKQEHGLAGVSLDKKVDAVVDSLNAPLKKVEGAANPTKAKTPEEVKTDLSKLDVAGSKSADTVIDSVKRKAKGPEGAGIAAIKSAGEDRSKGLTAGAVNSSPTFNFHGVKDEEIPKKVNEKLADHAREIRQRQREALHD